MERGVIHIAVKNYIEFVINMTKWKQVNDEQEGP